MAEVRSIGRTGLWWTRSHGHAGLWWTGSLRSPWPPGGRTPAARRPPGGKAAKRAASPYATGLMRPGGKGLPDSDKRAPGYQAPSASWIAAGGSVPRPSEASGLLVRCQKPPGRARRLVLLIATRPPRLSLPCGKGNTRSAAQPGGAITRSDGILLPQRRQAWQPVAAATLRARPARSARRREALRHSLAAQAQPAALLAGSHASRCPCSLFRRALRRAIGRSKSVRSRSRGAVPVATRSRPPWRPRLRTRGF